MRPQPFKQSRVRMGPDASDSASPVRVLYTSNQPRQLISKDFLSPSSRTNGATHKRPLHRRATALGHTQSLCTSAALDVRDVQHTEPSESRHHGLLRIFPDSSSGGFLLRLSNGPAVISTPEGNTSTPNKTQSQFPPVVSPMHFYCTGAIQSWSMQYSRSVANRSNMLRTVDPSNVMQAARACHAPQTPISRTVTPRYARGCHVARLQSR